MDGRWGKLRKLYDWCPREWRPVLLGRGVLQAPLQANGTAAFLWSLRKENLDWETLFAFGVERAAKHDQPRLLAEAARLVSALWGIESHSSMATKLNEVLHLTLVAMTPKPTAEDWALIEGLLPDGIPIDSELKSCLSFIKAGLEAPWFDPEHPPESHIAATKRLEEQTGITFPENGGAPWIWPENPPPKWMTAVLEYLAKETRLGGSLGRPGRFPV